MNACKDLEPARQHRVFHEQECVGESEIRKWKNEQKKVGGKIGVAAEGKNLLEHHVNRTKAGNKILNKNAYGNGK